MSIKYLHPTLATASSGWSPGGAGSNFADRINDSSGNVAIDTTKATPDLTNYQVAIFDNSPSVANITFTGDVAGTFDSGTIYLQLKADTTFDIIFNAVIDSTPYELTRFSVTGSFAEYTITLDTNPATSSAWTVEELNAIQLQIDPINMLSGTFSVATVQIGVTYQEETIPVASITQITPFVCKRGATLSIIGTTLGNSTSAAVVIGGTSITSFVTYTSTTIQVVMATDVSLGLQDVVLTTSSTGIATATDGVYVGSTDAFAKANIKLGRMSRLYFDGQHVGYIEDTVEINVSEDVFKYKSNDSINVQKQFIIGQDCNIKFTLSEISAEILAKVLNANYDTNTKTISIIDEPTLTDREIAFVDSAGVLYVFPVCNILEPANIVLRATQNVAFPVTVNALPDANGVVGKIIFPA